MPENDNSNSESSAKENLPLPPGEASVTAHVERRWDHILSLWKKGWHSESSITSLETYIEFHRKCIFEDMKVDGIFDWEKDWINAVSIHDKNIDFVGNRRAHNEDLKKLWFDWCERNSQGMKDLSLEALRGMILINGAAILASLTLLSGQIEKPNLSAVLAAKVMIFLLF